MRSLYQQRGYSVAGSEGPTLENNLKGRGQSGPAKQIPKSKFEFSNVF